MRRCILTDQTPINFDIIIEDGYVTTEFAGIVDVLRLANRIAGSDVFAFRFCSVAGGEVTSSAGARIDTAKMPDRPRAEFVVFAGNSNLNYSSKDISRAIRVYQVARAKILLLSEVAAMYITENADRAANLTTHWENRTLLEEKRGIFDVGSNLAADNDQIVTCAGLLATYDVMLSLISPHMSKAKLLTIASILLLERVRTFDTRQPVTNQVDEDATDPMVSRAIRLMQANLEEPISTKDLAEELNTTTRSLERKFKSELKKSPGSFYRELRLIRAHNLIKNTNMSLAEIAAACGFGTGFARAFKDYYGKTPSHVKNESIL
ncbi:MAG: helix-turn-helix domain-containing protein [Pseudomonadota bacterium]